jgi:hypothetical protein
MSEFDENSIWKLRTQTRSTWLAAFGNILPSVLLNSIVFSYVDLRKDWALAVDTKKRELLFVPLELPLGNTFILELPQDRRTIVSVNFNPKQDCVYATTEKGSARVRWVYNLNQEMPQWCKLSEVWDEPGNLVYEKQKQKPKRFLENVDWNSWQSQARQSEAQPVLTESHRFKDSRRLHEIVSKVRVIDEYSKDELARLAACCRDVPDHSDCMRIRETIDPMLQGFQFPACVSLSLL